MADGFLIHLDSPPSYSRLELGAPTMVTQVSTSDQMFIGDATGFAEFAVSSVPLPYVWRSGEFLYPKPENFSAGVIHAVGVGTARIYADGVLREEVPFHDLTYFRLRGGHSAYRWSVEFLGSAVVRGVYLAQSFAQLKGM